MLHIILLILKIIGIILLCILGVLLLAICCALFVPVRYRIEVIREEGEAKPPVAARVKITWMLHLVNILICYPADVYVRVRIFLFTLFRFPENRKKKNSRRRNRNKAGQDNRQKEKDGQTETDRGEDSSRPEASQDGTIYTDTGKQDEPAGQSAHKAENAAGQAEHTKQTDKMIKPEQGVSAAPKKEQEQNGSGQEPSGFIQRIRRRIRDLVDKIRQIIDKIKNAAGNIRYTIRRFCDKIKTASDTIQYYREVLESDSFRHSWALCRKQLGIIFKKLKPDKVEADLIVGTGDPASTGEILAICGMLYPWTGQHVRVVGDFERAHIEGRIYIKGKIRVFTFLRVAVKIYLDKDIKALIKLLKKEAV